MNNGTTGQPGNQQQQPPQQASQQAIPAATAQQINMPIGQNPYLMNPYPYMFTAPGSSVPFVVTPNGSFFPFTTPTQTKSGRTNVKKQNSTRVATPPLPQPTAGTLAAVALTSTTTLGEQISNYQNAVAANQAVQTNTTTAGKKGGTGGAEAIVFGGRGIATFRSNTGSPGISPGRPVPVTSGSAMTIPTYSPPTFTASLSRTQTPSMLSVSTTNQLQQQSLATPTTPAARQSFSSNASTTSTSVLFNRQASLAQLPGTPTPAHFNRQMSISALNVPIPVQVDMSTRDLLGEDALKAMVRQIDADIPMEDRRVPKMVADVLDDFVRDITERACKLAKHRKSDTVEIKDAHLALEMNYDIRVPGFGTDDIPDSRRRGGGPLRHVGAHQERTKAVRDALVGPDDGGQRGKGRGKRRPVETRS